eukprot:Partr_v1_DN26965_c0_g1_i4_m6786 putative asparagine-linked glycosylation 6, alpha-1,3-glucosyltransferase homolog (S. cerevisiae)
MKHWLDFNAHASVGIGLLLRFSVALGPHSGQNTPPMYGDFEAQRHFMEVALNLPITRWYSYDAAYWGLDYPPLTAFHSWLVGAFIRLFIPASMAFESSRGWESPAHRFLMRSSVVASDLLVYIPAIIFYCRRVSLLVHADNSGLPLKLLLLSPPALMIIDHGHFQYNSVMLGFVVWCVSFAAIDCYFLCAVAFCLALCFKHMALYFALPVFFYLLGECFRRRSLWIFIQLALGVVISFGVVLGPFVYHGGVEAVIPIFQRIFPVHRGLFEDKVANFWVATNLLFKYKDRFSIESLLPMSACLTLLMNLPACLMIFRRPTIRRFVCMKRLYCYRCFQCYC